RIHADGGAGATRHRRGARETCRADRLGPDPTDRLTPVPGGSVFLDRSAEAAHDGHGQPQPADAAVPLWAQLAGLVLLVALVGLSIDAYFGPGLRTRLGLGSGAQSDAIPRRVFYEPGSTARAGQRSTGSEGQERVLLEGDVVLLGATHQLVRLDTAGRVIDLP